MRNKMLRLALVAVMAGSLTACADKRPSGGGGGGNATENRMAANENRTAANDNRMAANENRTAVNENRTAANENRTAANENRTAARTTTDLTGENRGLAEAYARMAWVHANLAAGDWQKGLDDLKFISGKLDDLNKDKDISMPLKQKMMALRPHIALLTAQIQKHDKASVGTAAKLVNQCAAVVNDPLVLGWMGGTRKGGGAGR